MRSSLLGFGDSSNASEGPQTATFVLRTATEAGPREVCGQRGEQRGGRGERVWQPVSVFHRAELSTLF